MGTMTLSASAFAAARRFVETQGRPLESARLRAEFAGESTAVVLEALGAYRNEDGGFGRELEPDVRTPESSALCTSIAFQHFRSMGTPTAHPYVGSALSYLMRTLDRTRGQWRIVPQSAVNSPHAPWWNHAGDDELFGNFGFNPTAEILGYLYDHRTLVPDEVLISVRDGVLDHLDRTEKIDMQELSCYLRLFRASGLPGDLHDRLLARLTPLVEATVVFDPSLWAEYGLRPLGVIEGPDSPFMAGHEASVDANLDYLVSSQQADGSWVPTWTWGSAYPEEWPRARREWSGVITVGNLCTLKRFGRIEGLS